MTAYPPSPGTLHKPQDMAPGQQPNPQYAELYQAYERAYGSAHTLESALDAPAKSAGDAWAGPAARDWEGTLESHRAQLKRAAAQILWDIYGALSKVPPYLPK